MNIRTIHRKVQRNFEDYGLAFLLKKMVVYLLAPVYLFRVYRTYCLDLEDIDVPIPQVDNIVFKTLIQEDKEFIGQIENMEEWLGDQIIEKLKNESLVLVALDNDRVAGFNLISFGEVYIPLLEKREKLDGDEAWSEQITIGRQYRKLGLATALRYAAFAELKKRGIRKFYGGALKSNEGSLRLARRVGFRELQDIHFIKILGHRIWREREVIE